MLQRYICTTSGVVKHKDTVFADEERFFHNYEKRLYSITRFTDINGAIRLEKENNWALSYFTDINYTIWIYNFLFTIRVVSLGLCQHRSNDISSLA